MASKKGIITIGERQIVVKTDAEELRRTFVKAFAKRQNHDCAATRVGEWCGHKI